MPNDGRSLRIVLHDYGCYPFTVQLARSLAGRGHAVLYLFAGGSGNPRGPVERRHADPPTLTLAPIDIGGARRVSLWRRWVQEWRYRTPLSARIIAFDPDVVISANAPLLAQAAAVKAARRANAAFIFWMQDVHSMAVGRMLGRRLPVVGHVLAAWFSNLERRLVLGSDAVIVITDRFIAFLRRWGIADSRISVIGNWAPLDDVQPMPKNNAWSAEHSLVDAPVFLYAGTLGYKHDPAMLLALARARPDARTVVISEGRGAEWLREHAATTPSLLLLPRQPYARLSEVLASADVLVAILEPEAGAFSVPSKVLTYLTAERAILAAIPHDNPAAKMLVDSGAGRVVAPGDTGAFVAAANALLDDPDSRWAAARAGREFALARFDAETIAERFEAIVRRCVLPTWYSPEAMLPQ
jgi:glycosyltransferase involved in cell wall biosynthesis